jgi:hypothetical protein
MSQFSLLILISVALSTAHLDRIHKIFHDHPAKSCESCLRIAPQSGDRSVEVFQVLDLPLNVHEASLTKTERGYLLKLSLANSSELKIIGLRYSLAVIDSRNQLQPLVNRTEGFSIPGYDIKTLTFKSPIKFKQKDGERLVLMIEQVISRESIWEVVKAKDALEAYARGDYSVMPAVMRVANQVDTRPGVEIRYFRKP